MNNTLSAPSRKGLSPSEIKIYYHLLIGQSRPTAGFCPHSNATEFNEGQKADRILIECKIIEALVVDLLGATLPDITTALALYSQIGPLCRHTGTPKRWISLKVAQDARSNLKKKLRDFNNGEYKPTHRTHPASLHRLALLLQQMNVTAPVDAGLPILNGAGGAAGAGAAPTPNQPQLPAPTAIPQAAALQQLVASTTAAIATTTATATSATTSTTTSAASSTSTALRLVARQRAASAPLPSKMPQGAQTISQLSFTHPFTTPGQPISLPASLQTNPSGLGSSTLQDQHHTPMQDSSTETEGRKAPDDQKLLELALSGALGPQIQKMARSSQ